MKFQLKSKFEPAGDQPKAIEGLIKSLEAGRRYQTLLGVTGSGKSVVKDTPVLIKRGQEIAQPFIGDFINQIFEQYFAIKEVINDTELIDCKLLPPEKQFETYSFDPKTKQASWKPVTQITRHASPEHLYQINTTCGRTITVTGDHNFYALRNGQIELLKTGDLKQTDFIPIPTQIEEPTNFLDKIDILQYCSASLYVDTPELKSMIEHDKSPFRQFLNPAKIHHIIGEKKERLNLLTYQKIAEVIPQIKTDAVFGVIKGHYRHPGFLKLSPAILRLLGYYIAEGHAEKNYFIISSADSEIVNDFRGGLSELNLAATLRPKTYDYQISSAFITCIIKELCGGHSRNKKLPEFWTQLSNQQLGYLLKAYFSADGGVNGATVSCTTVSKELASQISYALLRFGVQTRTRKRLVKIPFKETFSTCWEIHISGQKNLLLYQNI